VCLCVQGWLKNRSPQEGVVLRDLFSSSFPELYRFSIQSLQYKMDMLEAFIIMQCINMLQGLIQPKVVVLITDFATVKDCLLTCQSKNKGFKGLVHPKMKIMSVFTHPHVVPTP